MVNSLVFQILFSIFPQIRFCKTQPPASIGWVARSLLVRRRSSSVLHCKISSYLSTTWCFRPYKPYLSVRILSWQHDSVIHCWVEPSLLLPSSISPQIRFLQVGDYLTAGPCIQDASREFQPPSPQKYKCTNLFTVAYNCGFSLWSNSQLSFNWIFRSIKHHHYIKSKFKHNAK